jgi:arylformamidase
MRWQDLSAQELEREFSPSSCIGGNYMPHILAYQQRSQSARTETLAFNAPWQRLLYGPDASHGIEICIPQAAKQPLGLLIFIHGGYWQELSAADSLFAAKACAERGLAFAAIDYTLAPSTSLDEIVAQCQAAVVYLHQHAPALGLDAERFVVAGSSAGAHLTAMTAQALPEKIRAVVLVSGVYVLEPLIGTTINDALGLTPASAQRNSPQLLNLGAFPKGIVCFGEHETAAFKHQSREFAATLQGLGHACECFEIANRNHFDVIIDLAFPNALLSQKTFALF